MQCPPEVTDSDVLTRAWRHRASLTLGPWVKSVPCGRRYAVACLSGWGLAGASDTVALVTSELLSNAVNASEALQGNPCPVGLWIQADDTYVLVMVGDGSRLAPRSGTPADDDIGGRGLILVEAVSARWDWFRFGSGKVVWALVNMPT